MSEPSVEYGINVEETDVNPHKEYDHNPFIVRVKLKEKTKLRKIQVEDDSEDDETLPPIKAVTVNREGDEAKIVYAEETHLDRSPHVKVFNDLNFLVHLSKMGIRVFTLIFKSITFDSDKILLSVEHCSERLETNDRKGIRRGITELCEQRVIVPSTIANVYWLNPARMYKGERRHLTYRPNTL